VNPLNTYFETQILTATPQRLRLTLIEEAIRRARLTADLWREVRPDDALESLIGCRAIISELLAGVREGESPLAKQVVALYVFLFQRLTELQSTRDAAALEAVVRVLEEERETWTQLCQQFADVPAAASRFSAVEERAPVASGPLHTPAASPGLSLEA
jgi:flagellar protein FliS